MTPGRPGDNASVPGAHDLATLAFESDVRIAVSSFVIAFWQVAALQTGSTDTIELVRRPGIEANDEDLCEDSDDDSDDLVPDGAVLTSLSEKSIAELKRITEALGELQGARNWSALQSACRDLMENKCNTRT